MFAITAPLLGSGLNAVGRLGGNPYMHWILGNVSLVRQRLRPQRDSMAPRARRRNSGAHLVVILESSLYDGRYGATISLICARDIAHHCFRISPARCRR